MLRQLALAASIVLTLTGISAANAGLEPAPLAGSWTGIVVIRPAEYEVDFVLRVERAEGGSLRGWVSYPTQGVKDQPLESVTTEPGGRVTFVAKDKDGVISTFQGWLSKDGMDMDGDLGESGQHYIFKLRRGAAPVSRPVDVKPLSPAGGELVLAFNQDFGRVRLLMILSPTCPMCLNSVRVVQRYVLDAMQSSNLRVYIVWEAVSPEDTPSKAEAASALIVDSRVRQFWSDRRFAGKLFQNAIGLKDSPAWDVALLFGVDKSWPNGSAPRFDSFMHNLFGRAELPKDRHLNGVVLAREVGALLEKRPAATVGR